MWCFCLSWLHNGQHHLSFNLIWLKLRRKNILKLPAGHSYSAIFPNRLIKETSEVQYETNSAQHLEKRDTFLSSPWHVSPTVHFGFTLVLFKAEFGPFS